MTKKEAIEITASYGHYAGKFLIDRQGRAVPLLHATYLEHPGHSSTDYEPVFITGFTEAREAVHLLISEVIKVVEKLRTHYLLPGEDQ